MISIPKNNNEMNASVIEKKIDEACNALVKDIERQRKGGFKRIWAQINTEHCATGGYPMRVINETARRFVKEGWFVYLIQGGVYQNWTWLGVFSEEQKEGYTDARVPNYYKRFRG